MQIDHWRRYAKLCRTVLCAGFGAAVLGGFPLTASAINKSGMSSYRYSISDSGKVASIRPNQGGSSGSMGNVGSVPSGQVGSQIGNTGWYVGASGSGNPSGRGTMNMSHTGDVFFSGVKYPFQAGYEVPKGALLDALGMLCKNPLLCAAAAAAPAIMQWMDKGKIRVNSNAADYPEKPFLITKDGVQCEYVSASNWPPMSSYTGPGWTYNWQSRSDGKGRCNWGWEYVNPEYPNFSPYWSPQVSVREVQSPIETLPASLDDIAPYMDLPDTPSAGAGLARDLLDKGADIQLPSAPTVTGPSQVQGPKQETNNADGSRTTTQTTNNYRTDGNKITNTSTTTTTNKCVGDGACSPVTTTTTTNPTENPDDKEDGDDCKKNPDSLACAQLDSPSGEIPKATRNVALQEQELFGGGSCPADRYSNVHGQQMLVWDWQQSCSYISTYMRPVLLLLCAIGAYLIVAGGLKQ